MFWHATITPATGETQEGQQSAGLLYLEICPSKKGKAVTPFKWYNGCFGFCSLSPRGHFSGSSVKWLPCHLGVNGACLTPHCNRTENFGISGREKSPLEYFHSSSLGIIPKGLGLVICCEITLSKFSWAHPWVELLSQSKYSISVQDALVLWAWTVWCRKGWEQNFLNHFQLPLDTGIIPWHLDGSPSSNNTLCMYLYCHILSFSAPWSLSALLLFLPAGNRIFRGFSESSL